MTFQRGDHCVVLNAHVEEGKLTFEPGNRGAKCYEINQVAQIAQPSPDLAHGLGGSPSPARPIGGGLGTTNTGTSDIQPESGLAGSTQNPRNMTDSAAPSSTICVICRLSVNDDDHVAVGNHPSATPGAEVVGQWLTKDELFPGSGQCKDCGDPLNQPGLMQRCRGRHNVNPA